MPSHSSAVSLLSNKVHSECQSATNSFLDWYLFICFISESLLSVDFPSTPLLSLINDILSTFSSYLFISFYYKTAFPCRSVLTIGTGRTRQISLLAVVVKAEKGQQWDCCAVCVFFLLATHFNNLCEASFINLPLFLCYVLYLILTIVVLFLHHSYLPLCILAQLYVFLSADAFFKRSYYSLYFAVKSSRRTTTRGWTSPCGSNAPRSWGGRHWFPAVRPSITSWIPTNAGRQGQGGRSTTM